MKEQRIVTDTTTTEPKIKKQGKTWKNSRLFTNYEEADLERLKLLTEGACDIKIKKRSGGKFVVKSRKKANERQQNN